MHLVGNAHLLTIYNIYCCTICARDDELSTSRNNDAPRQCHSNQLGRFMAAPLTKMSKTHT